MTPTSSHCKVQVCVSVHGIDDTAASAACRGLGHPYGRVADPSNVFGPGNGAVALSDLKCPPGAASLNSCDYSLGAWEYPGITWRLTVPCLHAQDLSIECFDNPPGALTGFLHWHAAGWESSARALLLPACSAGHRHSAGQRHSQQRPSGGSSGGLWLAHGASSHRAGCLRGAALNYSCMSSNFRELCSHAGVRAVCQRNRGRCGMQAARLLCRRHPLAPVCVWSGQASCPAICLPLLLSCYALCCFNLASLHSACLCRSGPILPNSIVCPPGDNQTRLDQCVFEDHPDSYEFCTGHDWVSRAQRGKRSWLLYQQRGNAAAEALQAELAHGGAWLNPAAFLLH